MNDAATTLQVEIKPDDVELIQYAFAKAAIANPLMVVIDGDDAVNYVAGIHSSADRRRDANSYLVKPVSRKGLLAMVKSIEAYWLKINQVTDE